jgi:hypothetical protein
MEYDTSVLLKSIRTRAQLPDLSVFQEADLLDFATEELREKAFPFIMSLRSDFGLVTEEYVLDANRREYPLPVRAHGGKLRAARLFGTDGTRKPLPIHSIEAVLEQLITEGAYFEGDNLVFPQAPKTGDRLMLSYYLRPSRLVDAVTASKVLVVAPTNTENQVLVTLIDPVNTPQGTPVDVYSPLPNFGTRGTDFFVANGTDPLTQRFIIGPGANRIRVGDIISEAGTSIIPFLPADAHTYLAQLVVARCMDAMGDRSGLESAQMDVERAEKSLRTLYAPRSEGEPQTLVNRTMLGV